jgi:adenylate kinase
MNLLLLGPQGSGKGTQARRIATEYGLPHIATGDMFRDAIAAGTELGRRVEPILERGDLVPDELTVELIRERLEHGDAREGFVLDGFPRTSSQAEALDELLHEIGRELDVVFVFHLPEDVAITRMQGRALEEGRSDDTPEAMCRRLEIYRERTEPLVEYYRARRGNVVGLHAERGIDEVFAEIEQALDQASAHRTVRGRAR